MKGKGPHISFASGKTSVIDVAHSLQPIPHVKRGQIKYSRKRDTQEPIKKLHVKKRKRKREQGEDYAS